MAPTNKSFSLFDFCKKRAGKVQVFGKESLDEYGNVISFIDQAAIVTHFLQLRNSKINIPYASKAESILNLWYEFIRGEREQRPRDFQGVSDSAIVR